MADEFNIESKVMLSGHVRSSQSILELIWIRKRLCAGSRKRRGTGGDMRRHHVGTALGASQGTDLKEREQIMMLDATRRGNHKDAWRNLGSPSIDIFIVRAWPRDAICAAAARSSLQFPR
jgi:hypothetical protein